MASDRLIICGPLPPSSNHLYATGAHGKRYLTKQGREYRKELEETMMEVGARKRCPKPPFALHLHLRFSDLRRRDVSNQIKLVEDTVFKYLGYDDTEVYDLHAWKYLDRANPGMVVEVKHCSRGLVGA